MREDICTIPVTDVFEDNNGCPICKMYKMLEERALDYVLGAAKMEPEIREQTNKKGFCGDHLRKMAEKKGSLGLALMLETHLTELIEKIFEKNDKEGKAADPYMEDCFLCEKIQWGFERMINTIYVTYERDKDFRDMFDSQPYICLPHYQALLKGAKKSGLKKYSFEFRQSVKNLALNYAKELDRDLNRFVSMFDYRNAGSDNWGNSKTAISRTVTFISGEDVKFKSSKK